eukprot:12425238-Karenia_brevis.AAC.1
MEVDGEKLDETDVVLMRSGDGDDVDFGEGDAPENDTGMPTPQDSVPDEVNGVPMRRRTLMVPNSARYDEERAKEIGVEGMVMLAPIQDEPQGNAETTWRRLFTKHQERFHPGT